MDKSDLKVLLVGVRESARSIFFRHGGRAGRNGYRWLSRSYNREINAVFAGAAEYYRTDRDVGQRFALRRHVHMLEKGLCMRPRRETFAVDYIESTVETFSRCVEAKELSDVELQWCFDVLTDYFEATKSSPNIRIRRSQARFEGVQRPNLALERSGPYRVGDIQKSVSIEDLSQLAANRSSVRSYLAKPVERSIIDSALQIALEAPTACNRVPWSMRIMEDSEEARHVASIAMGTAGYSEKVAHVAVLVGNLSAYFNERDRHLIYIDGSLAAMSFILGLQAQGVSSCCVNWPDIASRERKMASVLNLGDHERVIMLILFGYADQDGMTPYSGKVPVEAIRTFGLSAG